MKGVIDVLELQGKRDKVSARVPIDYRKHGTTFMGVRFIFEIGSKLDCKPQTITTAAYIFHKFFSQTTLRSYDIHLIASTSLLLSSKIKEEPLKIRDLINVSHNTLHREITYNSGDVIKKSAPPLELNEQYWGMRHAITQAELHIVRMLNFQLDIADPSKFISQYYKTLYGWLVPQDIKDVPVLQTAFGFLNDFHHDSAILNYKPEHVAIACLFLSFQCHGVPITHSNNEEHDELSWITAFDPELTNATIWDLAENLMDCYEKDSAPIFYSTIH